MLIFLGTYAALYGWKFAVALVYLIFVHECGHLYAARKLNIPTSPAIFIPFMGAVVGTKKQPKNAKEEAFIAYMGPLFGLLAFLPAVPLYMFTKDSFWALVIVLGSILNLFNLIPITPLDGGRIVSAISTKLWGLGLILLLVFAIWSQSFLAFVMMFLGLFQWSSIRKIQKNISDDRKRVIEYQEMLASLKNIAETSTYEHLQYFAKSLEKNLKEERELLETLDILNDEQEHEKEMSEEERERTREQKKQAFISGFEREVENIHKRVEQTASYYQTDGKTKLFTFLIYFGLAAVLGISSYLSFSLLPPALE